MMKTKIVQKIVFIVSALLFSVLSLTVNTATAEPSSIKAGKQYIELPTFPSPDKEVIEFFSFNCPSCFLFETELHISQAIEKSLPKGVSLKRYHLDDFGPLAPELSLAWAIANVLGIQDRITEPLYNAIHKERSLKTVDDIKRIFNLFDVDSLRYDKMKDSFLVKAFLSQQKEAVKELKPNAIPLVVVNRKYSVLASGLDGTNNQTFVQDYVRVTNFLSQLSANKK